ncbi:sterol desaturase family protein [Pseudoxanthomonas sp. UC19_8]|uniref:sterol desaturase family protein n=1 Tax=Pseudoxanthomonas sp. UC19_8 TaxID=3350175 RepID=UPI0036D4268A
MVLSLLGPHLSWLRWVPLVLPLLAALEAWLRLRRGLAYDWKSYWASLGDALGRGLVGLVLGSGVAGVVLLAVHQVRLTTLAMDAPWQWALLFVGQEACYYAMHRADHRIRWFWVNHCVHHSPEQYTLASAYRLGWTAQLTGQALFFAPLVWLGFPVPAVLGALALNLLYQFWLHTELIGVLPRWIEYVFNTPAHHRVHHASNPEYLDCNYGGVLIVFDRMFGSFRAQLPGVPPRYGLVEPLRSHHPVRIALHGWLGLWADLCRVRSPGQALRTLFGPPGFKPGG